MTTAPALPDAFLSRPLAHRALHDASQGRPENSRAAIRAAIAQGYGIEIDLQPASDGVPMVFHDEKLRRLTEADGAISGYTAAELGAMRLKGGSDGIPRFDEVLALVAGQVPLLVEIKDQDGALGPAVGALEEAAAEAARGYAGPLAFMSFNPHSVAELAVFAPQVPRGFTTCAFTEEDWPEVPEDRRAALRALTGIDAAGARFISHDGRDLASPLVAEFKARGGHVLTWTIRNAAEEAIVRQVAENITFESYLA